MKQSFNKFEVKTVKKIFIDNIHSFIISLIQCRLEEGVEPIPADFEPEAGYILDKSTL